MSWRISCWELSRILLSCKKTCSMDALDTWTRTSNLTASLKYVNLPPFAFHNSQTCLATLGHQISSLPRLHHGSSWYHLLLLVQHAHDAFERLLCSPCLLPFTFLLGSSPLISSFLIHFCLLWQWTNGTNMVKSKCLIALAAVVWLSEWGHDIITQNWFYIGIRMLFAHFLHIFCAFFVQCTFLCSAQFCVNFGHLRCASSQCLSSQV